MKEKKELLRVQNLTGKTDLAYVGEGLPISFSLNEGEVGVVLEGKEGSQLIRLIMGRGEITSGDIFIAGQSVSTIHSRNEFQIRWREKIGFSFRDKGLISNLSILDNVDLPARYHGHYTSKVEEGAKAANLLRELQVPEKYWGQRPDFVSWEIRKKALLARSVVLNPDILLMDDPTSLIQWEHLNFIIHWLKKQSHRAILISSDNLPFAYAIADWVLDEKTHERDDNFKNRVNPLLLESANLLLKQDEIS